MTLREIDDLFATALMGDYDDDQPWDAVRALRENGSRFVFEKAAEWSNAVEPLKRARCADVLCQLRAPATLEQQKANSSATSIFVQESFATVCQMIDKESDEKALHSELFALGHLGQEGSVDKLVRYASHASSDIRFAVAWSLGCFPNDPDSIASLLQLSDDTDDDVRNWALFALGSQSDVDSSALREILARHLEDPFDEAREEAIAGLAKRRDERAVLPTFRLMQSGSYPAHNEYDFEALVDEKLRPDDGWGTEDFIDALYARYSHLLPPRDA